MEEARGRPQKFNDELKSRVIDVIREYHRLTMRGVFDSWEKETFYSKDLDLKMFKICAMWVLRLLYEIQKHVREVQCVENDK